MSPIGIKPLQFVTAYDLSASDAVGIEQNDVDGFYVWVRSKKISCFL